MADTPRGPVPEPKALQARAAETRAALLDAALECLVERGYSATTTPEIARRAGVSRGAQLHHFPTKAELLAASVGRLLDRRLADFRKAFADLPPGTHQVGAAIDVLWSMFDSPAFVAWAELWMASRTDPDLAAVMAEVDEGFHRGALAVYTELFPPRPEADALPPSEALDLVFTVMEGMAFERLNRAAEHPPAGDQLAVLKYLADSFGPTADL